MLQSEDVFYSVLVFAKILDVSLYRICEKLSAKGPSSRETDSENGKSDKDRFPVQDKISKCSTKVHWFRKVPDCLVILPHLRQ